MADLQINIKGDSSGAKQAFEDVGAAAGKNADDIGKAAVKWQELANIAKVAIGAIVKFGVDSVKAYAESEKVQAQLTRVAGEYSEALNEQAQALMRLYAVDDDVIKQSETLLVQWGGVGAASKETTKAILDYAAATGQDAVSATQDLIRNVESGGAGLAKMGIHFETTGDRGKDLTSITAALAAKFGGAGAANADSLAGQVQAADLAFEDIKKTLGGSVAEFVKQTGAAGALTEALRNLNEFMTQDGAKKLADDGLRIGDWVNAQTELVNAEEALNAAMMEGASQTILAMFETDLANAQARVDKLRGSAAAVAPGAGSVDGTTNKGLKDQAAVAAAAEAHAAKMQDISDKNIEMMRKSQKDQDALDEHARQQDLDTYAAELEASGKSDALDIKTAKEREDIRRDMMLKVEEDNAKHAEKLAQAEQKASKSAVDKLQEEMKTRKDMWKKLGDDIGAAFINALGTQLNQLASGGEFDVVAFMGDLLAAAAGIAATAIGTAFGAPAVGAAIGNLAAMGIRAGFSGMKKAGTQKYHEGGWVGDEADIPRHHSGAWIGNDERRAILQTGERVLARNEVKNMGGSGAVDRAARGGAGGVTIYVSALDSKSAAESFETDVGRGLAQARRSGRGDVARMLGLEGSPR